MLRRSIPVLIAVATLLPGAPAGAQPGPPTIKIDQRQSGPFGDTIRAVSDARLQDEKTKQESLETKKKKQDTYYTMKRRDEQEREFEKSRNMARNERNAESRTSGAPDRLSSQELDRSRGTIRWPVTFDAATYATSRQSIESLYREQATKGNRSGLKQEFVAACDGLERILQQNLKSMPADEYLSAKKFLESLRYEQRYF